MIDRKEVCLDWKEGRGEPGSIEGKLIMIYYVKKSTLNKKIIKVSGEMERELRY